MVELDQFSVGVHDRVHHDSWKEWRDALKIGDNNVSGKKGKSHIYYFWRKKKEKERIR